MSVVSFSKSTKGISYEQQIISNLTSLLSNEELNAIRDNILQGIQKYADDK
jgi:predicted Zn-dependent peptidase